MVGRGIVALASPILSRIYTPADFGIRSVLFSLTAALVIICALNYEAAIPLPKDDELGLSIMVLSFVLLLLNTAVCVIAVLFFAAPICRLLGIPQLQRYLWLLPIGVVTGGIFFILNSWAIRVQAFKSLAKRRITQSAFQVATQLGTPLITHGPLGLILGDCVGRAGGSTSLLADTWEYVRARKLRVSVARAVEALKRYKRFPVFGLSSVLMHTSFSLLPPLLLTRLYGLQEAGWFGMAYQALGVTIEFVGIGIGQVYFSYTAQSAHSSPGSLRPMFLKMSRATLLVGLPPLALLAVASPWLFRIVFGARWIEAGRYGQILALPFLVMFVANIGLPVLTVLERQHWQLIADMAGVAILCSGVWYAHHLGLSGRWAVGAFGMALILTYSSFYGLAWYAIQHPLSHVTRQSSHE